MVPRDVVVPVAYMGAPTIGIERIASGKEPIFCLQALKHLYTVGGYKDGDLGGTGNMLIVPALVFSIFLEMRPPRN